jgi:hypothetical protein
MPITGTDDISLAVIDALNSGTKVKDIPAMFPVSIDNAKRLSRYNNFLEKSKEHLSEAALGKIKGIGLKALHLAPLFKEEDWEGLTEVLSSINEHTKRDELPLLTEALNEKRKRVADFERDVNRKLDYLKRRENELLKLEEETNYLREKAREQTQFLNKYSQQGQDFLIKHLGLHDGKLVLARRLNYNWQKALKKKEILSYNEWKYIWYVNDLDSLVVEYENRINRKKPYPTEWEHGAANEFSSYQSAEYKLPTGLATDLLSSIREIDQKKKELEAEREDIQKQIKDLRKTSPKSFLESVEASNVLSTLELKRHGELQDKALKWLYNRGYIVASEVTLPNGRRADVIGFSEFGHIVIVEVKASMSDFVHDEKWQSYLDYCDLFYFLLDDKARPAYFQRKYRGVGLLQETKNSVKVEETHELQHEAKEREKIHFSISKVLTKKYVYGY